MVSISSDPSARRGRKHGLWQAVDLGLKVQFLFFLFFEWASEIILRKKENKSPHGSSSIVGFHYFSL